MSSSIQSPADAVRRNTPGERRGVVLIFVVAVLVLLAVIATTYLSMARIDRVNTEIRGGLASGFSVTPTIPLEELRLDVFDSHDSIDLLNPGANEAQWRYRAVEGLTASNYGNFDFLDEDGLYRVGGTLSEENLTAFIDRQRHDPWLASRTPSPFDGTTFSDVGGAAFVPAWRKISRWVERWDDEGWVFDSLISPNPNHVGFFESPYDSAVSGYPTPVSPVLPARPPTTVLRNRAIPTYLRINYETGFSWPRDYDGKTALYPAIVFPDDLTKIYLAADTDGDGVADAMLFPLDGWRTHPEFADATIQANTLYPGDTNVHTRRWYAAVRIVDSSAAINVNTAWRRNADINFSGGGDPSATYEPANASPNYGFFRSNIGLFELLPGLPTSPTEWEKFTNFRFGQASAAVTPNTGRVNNDYVYSTLGEVLEMGLARRPANPATSGAAGVYGAFPATLSSSLAYLNGLINPREGKSSLETYLDADLYHNVANWVASDSVSDLDKENRSFTFFAAPSAARFGSDPVDYIPRLWWNSLYNPDVASRNAYFSDTTFFPSGAAYAGNPPPRTVRQLLTTANPQSTSSRSLELTNPQWLIPNPPTQVGMTAFSNIARPKASINTDNFSTLWRQFYLSMGDPNFTPVVGSGTRPIPPAPEIPPAPGTEIIIKGRPSAPTVFTPEESLYVRSAMAAVNAMDQRDGDDDITTYRFNLHDSVSSMTDRWIVVAGAEHQLFITSVKVDTTTPPSGPPTKSFTIGLKNPYDRQITGAAYKLAFLPPTGGSYVPIPSITIPDVPAGGVVSVSVPVPTSGEGDLVLLRTRRADGVPTAANPNPIPAEAAKNPYSETGGLDQLICVDIVQIGDFAVAATVTAAYDRDVTDWKIASTGGTFPTATAGTRDNPVALDNLPPAPVGASATFKDELRGAAIQNNRFPFSSIPRDGDMMMIPWVGHWAIFTAAGTLVDAAPITLDVQSPPTAAVAPQITGRFTPTQRLPASGVGTPAYSNDWRARIFDNFTTLANPMADFTPNMARESWLNKPGVPSRPPTLVDHNDPQLNDAVAPVHGLVNINTADFDVLRMVPWVTNASGVIDGTSVNPAADASFAKENDDIARAILLYRRANGPFKSVIDLLNMPALPNFPQPAPTALQGNFYDNPTTPSAVMGLYAGKYHNFIRVSNLVTTRSDSYVVYVIIQQWQDFGTNKPVLVPNTEKRIAAIVDRSQLRDTSKKEDAITVEPVSTN